MNLYPAARFAPMHTLAPSARDAGRRLRGAVAILLLGALAVPAARAAETAPATDDLGNSVVKIFSTIVLPNPYQPWIKQAPREISGSGVIIAGDRILTNAHVVLYATDIQVQGRGAGDKVSATVESIAPGIDLAVLKVDDPTFFASRPPLTRASILPRVKDTVLVYGYPLGGTSLAITRGIVSRIEFVAYNFPVDGLRIQIDAALNPGNSGGPVVVDGRMIGLAFSRLNGEAQNIGYVIPTEEIELFLHDVADGHYDGKPIICDNFQALQNATLRAYLKVPPGVHGVVVNIPFRDDPDYPLKRWDVVTRIGDTPIDDQGKIVAGDDLHLFFTYLVQKLARDGHVPLTILRDGQTRTVELPVPTGRPLVVPDLNGAYPSYFIYGPLVFTAVTTEFLGALNADVRVANVMADMDSPLETRRLDPPAFPGEQLVAVAAPFFPSRLAEGYSSAQLNVVKTVNGIPIRNLRQLVEVLRDAKDEYLAFVFDGRGRESPVFRRAELAAATNSILDDNGVRSQGSPDMLAVWNAKPAP
jgi:S1-C subfamily serine protease